MRPCSRAELMTRTINGATHRYIEYFKPLFEEGDDIDDAHFVDAGVIYDGAAATTMTGLGHLEAESVTILADGSPVAAQVVDGSGEIELAIAASKVHIGLGYTGRITTMPLVPRNIEGRGKKKNLFKVIIRIFNSLGGSVGTTLADLEPIQYRDTDDESTDPPPLSTGEKEIQISAESERGPVVIVEQTVPQPMTILNITSELDVNAV